MSTEQAARPSYGQVADALFVLVEMRLQKLFDALTDDELRVLVSQELTDAEVRTLLRRVASMPNEPSESQT